MINIILTAISFLIIGLLFSWLKGKIVKKFMNTSKKIITNARIGNSYKKDGSEVFKWDKFKKIFYLGSGVEWVKSIKEIIDLRKLLIYMTIVSLIFAFGWWKGKGDKPVNLNVGRYQEIIIKLNGEQLHIYKNGDVWIEEYKTGKKIKQIKVKDIPFLNDKLKPVKLKLRPILVAGGSTNVYSETGGEVGVGFSFMEMWKLSLEGFITSYSAVYGGVSYAITDNTGVGIGYGKGIRELDDRIIIYGRIRF